MYKCIVIVASVLLSMPVLSQHNHGGGHSNNIHDSPQHAGYIKSDGKYYVEMVVNMYLKQDQLIFYLYNRNKIIPNNEITGVITIEYKSGAKATDTLSKNGRDRFVGQLDSLESFNCQVDFFKKRKKISVFFTHEGLGSKPTTIFTCVMHPNIKEDKPGICKFCGMELREVEK